MPAAVTIRATSRGVASTVSMIRGPSMCSYNPTNRSLTPIKGFRSNLAHSELATPVATRFIYCLLHKAVVIASFADGKDGHLARAVSATMLTDRPQVADRVMVKVLSSNDCRTCSSMLTSVVFSLYWACCCPVNCVRTDCDAHVQIFEAVVTNFV
ncbi:hypothetical protein TNCV_3388601 [Trichonephila clavipes]|nr:hypothetical protein TNCV_3388601 [Trichonephila clavipes]